MVGSNLKTRVPKVAKEIQIELHAALPVVLISCLTSAAIRLLEINVQLEKNSKVESKGRRKAINSKAKEMKSFPLLPMLILSN